MSPPSPPALTTAVATPSAPPTGAMRRSHADAAVPAPPASRHATPTAATAAVKVDLVHRRFIPAKGPAQHSSLIEKRKNRRSLEFPSSCRVQDSSPSWDPLRKSASTGECADWATGANSLRTPRLDTLPEKGPARRFLGALAESLRRSPRPSLSRRHGVVCHSAFPGLLQWEKGSSDGLHRETPPPPSKATLNGLRTCKSWYAGYGTLHDEHDTRALNEQPSWLGRVGPLATSIPANADAHTAKVTAAMPSSPAPPQRRAALDALLGTLAGRRAASRDSALAAAAPSPAAAELRKCSTSSTTLAEPLRPVNRLRSPPGVCSRCSSLLSLAGATGSRYSLDALNGGFVPVVEEAPQATLSVCKVCLEETQTALMTTIVMCGCSFCTRCMQSYAEIEITNGAYELSCPDASCRVGGALSHDEIELLVGEQMLNKHKRYKLNHEVVMDTSRAWCPRAGCETVCHVSSPNAGPGGLSQPGPAKVPPPRRRLPLPVHCPTCDMHFCNDCNQEWHESLTCDESAARRSGSDTPAAAMLAAAGLPPDSDLIKWCPMCRVPIEKDEGCAQMMCKRCKHVFCWYCLASLDDDFLLRHYDKGPCKNKLGHSRASVIWHRAQVVGIFAGFGLLLLVASPLLLLAAPCIVCCKCRLCNTNGAKNLDEGDEAEAVDLDRDNDNEHEDEIRRIRDSD